jgi:tRNA pseudouridine38-40 synthase
LNPLNKDSEHSRSELAPYRIDLKYNGQPFQGWQSQIDGSGVQDHLQKALSICLRHDVKVIGASRTDTGVHAQHQVALFRSDVPFDGRKWIKSLNGLLPHTIGVEDIQPAKEHFHPIGSPSEKIYRYLVSSSIKRNPFLRDYAWEVHQAFDRERLKFELSTLVGTFDFSSFCAADSGAKTRTRTLHEISVFEHGDFIEIWFRGSGFLKQMIRIVVGTALHLVLGKLDLKSMSEILAAKDRKQAGITAPGQGLTLMRISYNDQCTIEEIRQKAANGLTFLV